MRTMFYQSAGDHRLRTLIWKDYRANRLVLIVGAFLVIAPYLVTAFLFWRSHFVELDRLDPWRPPPLEIALFGAAFYSLGLSCLTFALLGGNLIAGERADGSAEFLGSLPPSRAEILASKGILVLIVSLVIWGGNLLSTSLVWSEIYAALNDMGKGREQVIIFGQVLTGIGATGLVLFGVGWLASSLVSSPAFAVLAALVVPPVVGALLSGCYVYLAWPAEKAIGSWYIGICAPLGLLCLVCGTWYYLRRIEP